MQIWSCSPRNVGVPQPSWSNEWLNRAGLVPDTPELVVWVSRGLFVAGLELLFDLAWIAHTHTHECTIYRMFLIISRFRIEVVGSGRPVGETKADLGSASKSLPCPTQDLYGPVQHWCPAHQAFRGRQP